jgi:hypothetical protein
MACLVFENTIFTYHPLTLVFFVGVKGMISLTLVFSVGVKGMISLTLVLFVGVKGMISGLDMVPKNTVAYRK